MASLATDMRTSATLALAIAALLLAGWTFVRSLAPLPTPFVQAISPADRSPFLKAMNAGTIAVGYGGYPPYTIEDPRTGAVSGLNVDLMNEITSQLKVKLVWKKFNWSTMSADMKRGEIDVIADPIFETIPRAREFAFTEPYAYVPTGIGIVRTGGKKIPSFDDLNSPTIKIAVGQGFAEETLLRARASNADIIAVATGSDTAAAANLVLSGRADIAIVTLSDAKRFLAANPDRLEALWIDKPPAYMAAGFALQFGDELGASFLNVAIRNLKYTGTISSLARRYQIEEDFRAPQVDR